MVKVEVVLAVLAAARATNSEKTEPTREAISEVVFREGESVDDTLPVRHLARYLEQCGTRNPGQAVWQFYLRQPADAPAVLCPARQLQLMRQSVFWG